MSHFAVKAAYKLKNFIRLQPFENDKSKSRPNSRLRKSTTKRLLLQIVTPEPDALQEKLANPHAEAQVEWYIKLFLGVHFADNLA